MPEAVQETSGTNGRLIHPKQRNCRLLPTAGQNEKRTVGDDLRLKQLAPSSILRPHRSLALNSSRVKSLHFLVAGTSNLWIAADVSRETSIAPIIQLTRMFHVKHPCQFLQQFHFF